MPTLIKIQEFFGYFLQFEDNTLKTKGYIISWLEFIMDIRLYCYVYLTIIVKLYCVALQFKIFVNIFDRVFYSVDIFQIKRNPS